MTGCTHRSVRIVFEAGVAWIDGGKAWARCDKCPRTWKVSRITVGVKP